MFGHINGKVINLKPTKAILEVGGLGFIIHSTLTYIQKLRLGANAEFWTHTAVRENSIDLYGFEREEELEVFELLITVSGIGPKSALAIINIAGIEMIKKAVSSGEAASLTKISGIGKKTAEKIILELQGKLGSPDQGEGGGSEDVEVFEALKSLGYRERDIQEIIKSLPGNISGTGEKIKYAIKNLTS